MLSTISVRSIHAHRLDCVAAITWWLEQGRPYTPREIATRSARLAAALFKEASAWQ